MPDKTRCAWAVKTEIEREYHDTEWGVPRYDDMGQFEFLVLESAQAGLSWLTILRKREGYRKAFAGFDPGKIAAFTEKDVERLMGDAGIVRNRKKIESTITNARLFLDLAGKHGGFSRYIWNFVDGKPVVNHWKAITDVPPTSAVSDAMAKEFKRLGFKFLGSTLLYAYMQATGMVNDHLVTCFRHEACLAAPKR